MLVWFPDPSCMGGAREGREGRITRPQRGSMEFHYCLIIDSCEATNTYKPHVHTAHSHGILFTTRTYLTFALSLINADGRNAAVDPRWGRVIHQTLPSLPSLAPPTQEGSGNQTTRSRMCGHGTQNLLVLRSPQLSFTFGPYVRAAMDLYRRYKERVGDAISVKTLVWRSPGLPDLLRRSCSKVHCLYWSRSEY